MPGAGGIRGANHLSNVAAKDGTVMGIFDQAVFLDQLLGVQGLRGDVRRFNWIGRLVGNSAVLFSWHTARDKQIGDASSQETIVAGAGHSMGPNRPGAQSLR